MKRREFLNGPTVGAAALVGTSAALRPMRSLAQDAAAKTSADLRDLSVGYRTIDVRGRSARVFGLVGSDGTPGLTLDAGAGFDVALSSAIDEPTLIHWQGLTPPWAADGMPDAADGESRACLRCWQSRPLAGSLPSPLPDGDGHDGLSGLRRHRLTRFPKSRSHPETLSNETTS